MLTRLGLALAAVFACALTIGIPLARGQEEPSPLQGKPAPDFALKTLDGKDIKLSEFRGKVVLLDFWATWCPPCRKSLPHLQELRQNKELADQGLVVLGVNAKEVQAKVEAFMTENKYTFTVPMDKGETMKAYMVRGIPTTVVVGRDGTVKNVLVGFGEGSAKLIDDAVAAALKDPKPAK